MRGSARLWGEWGTRPEVAAPWWLCWVTCTGQQLSHGEPGKCLLSPSRSSLQGGGRAQLCLFIKLFAVSHSQSLILPALPFLEGLRGMFWKKVALASADLAVGTERGRPLSCPKRCTWESPWHCLQLADGLGARRCLLGIGGGARACPRATHSHAGMSLVMSL